MNNQPWNVDPARLPKRIDLELSAEVYERLEDLSRRTGRSIRDLAEEMICRQAVQLPNP
jgi:predicted DNA-binding protein